MKRTALGAIVLSLFTALLVAATTNGGKHRGQQDVYFGFLLGTPRIAAVAVDLGPPDRTGNRTIRVYVCDGFGPPEGMAIWFTGHLTGTPAHGSPQTLMSVTSQERLVITRLTDRDLQGAFTDRSGVSAHFVVYPAMDGAGIYDVTLDQSLRYTGMSTNGNRLEAQVGSDGTASGTIVAAGKPITFTVRNLALASPADLATHGLPDQFRDYAANSQVPGAYVAVISPGGTHWFGRSGLVRTGSPGVAIIGLDKAD